MKYSRCLLGNYDHTVHFRNFWFNCYILLIKKMLCSLTWAAHVLCGGGAGCGIVLGLAQQAQVQDHQANTTNNTLHLVSSASNYIQQTVLCLFKYCRLSLISLIHVHVQVQVRVRITKKHYHKYGLSDMKSNHVFLRLTYF